MDSDKSKLKVISLVVVGLSISVLSFIYAYSQLSGSPDKTDEQFATFPDSEARELPPAIPADDSITQPSSIPATVDGDTVEQVTTVQRDVDWRDEIIQSSSNNTNSVSTIVTQKTEIEAEPDVESFYAAAEELSRYTPEYPDYWPLPSSTPPDSMSFSEYSKVFNPTKINYINPSKCEDVVLPSSESEQKKFIDNLEKNNSVICMGKAVAEDCSYAKTEIINADTLQILVVAKRGDGVCVVGTSYDDKYVNLCSITNIMNSLTSKRNSFLDWKSLFMSKPGETFAQLYLGIPTALSEESAVNKLDCKTFEL